jgi:hypothetical protein
MEVVNPRSCAGAAKLAGAGLCLTGVLTIAFYSGPGMSSVSHQRAFAAAHHANHPSRAMWIEGTFLLVLDNISWAICTVWQVLRSLIDYWQNIQSYPSIRLKAQFRLLKIQGPYVQGLDWTSSSGTILDRPFKVEGSKLSFE